MMNLLFGALVLIVLSSATLPISGDECGVYTQCADCIRLNSSCAWCNDINVLRSYAANATSTAPAPLCATKEQLNALNCQNIVNPTGTVNAQTSNPADDTIRVSITSAQVDVRPGVSTLLNVTISPAESTAVDMYLLMDLSLTMLQNLNNLRTTSGMLVQRMKDLSSDFRIGFGSFIDKPISPFADKFVSDFPCARDANILGLTVDDCDSVYAYRHRLNLTSDGTLLNDELSNVKLSASPDRPESLLDALLQVAVCEEEVGWSVKGQSRRLIVAVTNGDYHFALDGRLAGIVSQPDIQCRLDPTTHEYTESILYDYPSATLISDVLNQNLITPIFAVPSQVRSLYDGLVASIRSASVGTLSSDSTSLINLIEDQYRLVASTVVPVLTLPPDLPPDLLEISVLPLGQCGSGSLSANSTDTCLGIVFPNTVTYQLSVSATPEACTQLSGRLPLTAQLQFIGFGSVEVSINLLCDCNCDAPEENSTMCSEVGRLECSTCICNDERTGGPLCDCQLGVGAELGCFDPFDTEGRVCNGRGRCECGQCICSEISDDSPLVFSGPYCQFNPLSCPHARDDKGVFKPCAGHGSCISSRCDCDEGFTGGACDCTRDNSSCVHPGDKGSGTLCSGQGDCVCGVCICNDYGVNFGQYCEECVPCRTSCSRVSECVKCSVLGNCQQSSCESQLIFINDTKLIPVSEDFKVCSFREGSCEVRYTIGTDLRGDEDTFHVVMDESQPSVAMLRRGNSNCVPQQEIWPIFVGIILGIIVVGLLAVILWRCCTYIGEYLEFKQWQESKKEEPAMTKDNPLFVDPNSSVSNPRYRTPHRPTN